MSNVQNQLINNNNHNKSQNQLSQNEKKDITNKEKKNTNLHEKDNHSYIEINVSHSSGSSKRESNMSQQTFNPVEQKKRNKLETDPKMISKETVKLIEQNIRKNKSSSKKKIVNVQNKTFVHSTLRDKKNNLTTIPIDNKMNNSIFHTVQVSGPRETSYKKNRRNQMRRNNKTENIYERKSSANLNSNAEKNISNNNINNLPSKSPKKTISNRDIIQEQINAVIKRNLSRNKRAKNENSIQQNYNNKTYSLINIKNDWEKKKDSVKKKRGLSSEEDKSIKSIFEEIKTNIKNLTSKIDIFVDKMDGFVDKMDIYMAKMDNYMDSQGKINEKLVHILEKVAKDRNIGNDNNNNKRK